MAVLLHDPAVRERILTRLGQLAPTAKPQWGKMAVDQMLWHVNEALRVALGQTPSIPSKLTTPFPLPIGVMRFMVLNAPWPKGAPTAPQFVATDRYTFDAERATCVGLIGVFVSRDIEDTNWGPSPVLGRMSGRELSRLHAKHLHHHLTQFGA